MSAKLRTHIRSNIIGYVALFFALSTGSAVALSGSNTVFTDDIVNDQVYSADVRNDALSGGGLAAPDLRPSSVGTSEVAANSLNGGDINESGLGIVPNANQLDGVDSSGFLASGNVQKLIFNPGGPTSATALATVGPSTIKADCDVQPGTTSMRLMANVAGPVGGEPGGSSDYMHHEHHSLGGAYTHRSGQVGMLTNTDTEIIAPTLTAGNSGEVARTAGTAMLRTGSAVVQVDFNGVADNIAGACSLYGTATMGT
jgi:hypothetical protein